MGTDDDMRVGAAVQGEHTKKVSSREHRDNGNGLERCRDVGSAVAAYIRANPDAFQAEAALVGGGISERLHYRWLEGSDESCEAYQREVLPALYEQAHSHEKRAEADIGSSENGSGAWAGWHKWKLATRYKKLFGELGVQRIEHTGKDGAPIATDARVSVLTPEVAEDLKRKILFGKRAKPATEP